MRIADEGRRNTGPAGGVESDADEHSDADPQTMEVCLLAFAEALRRNGIRVSTAEIVDAAVAARQPGMVRSRERLSAALRSCIVTRPRDLSTFDAVFALFFALRPVDLPTASAGQDAEGLLGPEVGSNAEIGDMALVDATKDVGQIDSGSSAEADMREFFDPESLKQGRNLDEDADLADLASMSDEISFSPSGAGSRGQGMKVQLDVSRTRGDEPAGALTPATGQAIDLDLSGEEENQLLAWLGAGGTPAGPDDTDPDLLSALLQRLPEQLAAHLQRLMNLRRTVPELDEPSVLDRISPAEEQELENSLRQLAHSLRGGLSQKLRPHPRGRVAAAATARRSMRFDGVPFRPVTVSRVREKPKVVVLADVSLSVRATARFTLHVVHGMQARWGRVRSFVFVDEVAEVTELFAAHPIEHALGLTFGGDVLDTEANTDYGAVFTQFADDHAGAIDHRTSLLVLGDARSNGKDPAVDTFAELARAARTTIWLTPEPSYSWGLGACALAEYAEHCDRVEVVRDLRALERTAESMSEVRP